MKIQTSMMTAAKVFKTIFKVLSIVCFACVGLFLVIAILTKAGVMTPEPSETSTDYVYQALESFSSAVTFVFAYKYCVCLYDEKSAFSKKSTKLLFTLGIVTAALPLAASVVRLIIESATKTAKHSFDFSIDLVAAGLCMVALSMAFSMEPFEKTARSLRMVCVACLVLCVVSMVVFIVGTASIGKEGSEAVTNFILGNSSSLSHEQSRAKAICLTVLHLLSASVLIFVIKYLSSVIAQKTIFSDSSAKTLLGLGISMIVLTVAAAVALTIVFAHFNMIKSAGAASLGMISTGECLIAFSFVVKWGAHLDEIKEAEEKAEKDFEELS